MSCGSDPKAAIVRDGNGNLVREIKDGQVVPQVAGEREVWAQSYGAALRCLSPGFEESYLIEFATKHADAAVKAFRERYK